jgi:septin family protein
MDVVSYLCLLGESGTGKTTFINTLFTCGLKAHQNYQERTPKQIQKTLEIEVNRYGMACLHGR